MSTSRKDIHRKKRRNKRIIFTSIALFFLIYTVGWVMFNQVNSTIGNLFNDISIKDKRDGSDVVINATQPISFALLGVDNGVADRLDTVGRSDAIIIGTINPNTNKTTLVSIPRDTYAIMEGYETYEGELFYDKITHAYAFGEAEMAINSIQELINIPIDYYVEVNMQGLMDIVNALEGIEVESPLTFDYQGFSFVEGETHLMGGHETLAFSRMRKDDPEGDFGRQKREKLVIEAIISKVLSFDTITNYQNILKTMEDNVKMNVSFKQLSDFLIGYRKALGNITQDKLIGEELWLDEIYYLYVNPDERLKISNTLRNELELDEIDVEDLELSDIDKNYLDTYYYDSYYSEDDYVEDYQYNE
ncbi:hypothetical protein BW721_05810 [Jeotgalibaca sp. PTS2502]|uniref:LCP family glycopolymer transferase n=1 Tax=Jeotgalibaca sp. PTS2502 TaxID=1903686 RepID=UPI00097359FD|nr:LCP family protein [Jeotgalibaca sp. PTS2502]APZ49232.1 hypothetical protein BW721_05810 [Jeotgalibaca sp. PTS2502]